MSERVISLHYTVLVALHVIESTRFWNLSTHDSTLYRTPPSMLDTCRIMSYEASKPSSVVKDETLGETEMVAGNFFGPSGNQLEMGEGVAEQSAGSVYSPPIFYIFLY